MKIPCFRYLIIPLSGKEIQDLMLELWLAIVSIKTFIFLSFLLYLFLAILVGIGISLLFAKKACITISRSQTSQLKGN